MPGWRKAVGHWESMPANATLMSAPCMDTEKPFTYWEHLPSMYTTEQIQERVRSLGPWFHNMSLRGVRTAPEHFLGDYPGIKWRNFQHAIPADLAGQSVLDIGCNGGFYAMEMKRRGALRVLG